MWAVVKKTAPLTLFVNAISAVIAYGFYEMSLRASSLPCVIAIGVLGLSIVGPLIVVFIDAGRSRLVALGIVNIFMVAAFYFFCGVVPFFFYFVFVPMSRYLHAAGLIIGVAMTAYWMMCVARDVGAALVKSQFAEKAFADVGGALQYRLQGVARLEAAMSARNPSGKFHMYVVLLVAPFSLVIGRVLSPVFGPHGPILLVAFILFPVSQWLAGLGVRQYMVMIRLPRIMERIHGKPVVVVADES